MSRLIIKNLPPKITDDKLRNSFSAHGNVTDVQLKYTKEGKFRNFGFIGFKTEDEAAKAQTFFNGSYIGACKVQVEVCANLGDIGKKPRAWSKYSKDSSAYKQLNPDAQEDNDEEKSEKDKAKLKKKERKKAKREKAKEVEALMAKYKDDPKFQEFMRVHQRNTTEKWNNEAILQAGKAFEDEREEEEDEPLYQDSDDKKALDSKLSDLDYLKSKGLETSELKSEHSDAKEAKKTKEFKEFFTVKLHGLPCTAKKRDVKKFFGQKMGIKSIRVPRDNKGFAYVGFASEAQRKAALAKNKSFIGGHQILVKIYDKDLIQRTMEARESKWRQQEETLNNLEETVGQSGRLFVRNLTYTVTEDELEALFKPFGPLAEVHLPIDKVSRQVKGFGFVTFVIPENAVQAYTKLDGTSFQGRTLHLIPAKPAKDDDQDDGDGGGHDNNNFKKKKLDAQKKEAGSSHNWNSLFLSAAAVAELMATKYQVDKQDVLLGSGGDQSAAVRLALGETQIVDDTRRALEAEGVKLEAFNGKPVKRSKTVILAKNLPAQTSIEVIRDMFAKHGQLSRVVLPPMCSTSLIEFTEASEARTAFRALAYTNFKGTPLYLEWAPEDSFTKPSDQSMIAKKEPVAEEKPDHGEEAEAAASLFVKNLNFETTETSLRTHFENQVGKDEIVSVSIATKKDPKNPGKLLSMGYGFVNFRSSQGANEALKTLQNKMLDFHSLELKRSTRASVSQSVANNSSRKTVDTTKEASAKIIVRNVPFEATEKEVRSLFTTFGQLKGVRLPKKVTGSHRGFAFVEFLTKEQAKKAFEKLCHSTHLYGRRLVLEWAEQEDTVDSLRKRTAQQFGSGEPAAKKRVKKTEFMEQVAKS